MFLITGVSMCRDCHLLDIIYLSSNVQRSCTEIYFKGMSLYCFLKGSKSIKSSLQTLHYWALGGKKNTFGTSFRACWDSDKVFVAGCHDCPTSAPGGPDFLVQLRQESIFLSSWSFSAIQLLSWARESNFSCKSSLVESCNWFCVCWSLWGQTSETPTSE